MLSTINYQPAKNVFLSWKEFSQEQKSFLMSLGAPGEFKNFFAEFLENELLKSSKTSDALIDPITLGNITFFSVNAKMFYLKRFINFLHLIEATCDKVYTEEEYILYEGAWRLFICELKDLDFINNIENIIICVDGTVYFNIPEVDKICKMLIGKQF